MIFVCSLFYSFLLQFSVSFNLYFSTDVDYENVSTAQPKRSVSFEKAVQRGKIAMIKPLPAEKKPTSPPPIPRRQDWLVSCFQINALVVQNLHLGRTWKSIAVNLQCYKHDGIFVFISN